MNQNKWNSVKKSIKISTGITLKYVEMGDRNGDAVILLHGITDSSRSWSLAAEYLDQNQHIFILDQRGFGDTEKPVMRIYPLELYAEDVNAFMEALHIPKASIVGHSMGSFVARIFAFIYPEKTEKLVLVSTGTTLANRPVGLSLWELVNHFENSPIDMKIMDELDATPNPVDETFLGLVKREASNLPLYVWKASFRGMITENHISFLAEMKAPTMIIWGELDDLFSAEDQKELQQYLPKASYITFPGCGHNLQWEQPEKAAQTIQAFLLKTSE